MGLFCDEFLDVTRVLILSELIVLKMVIFSWKMTYSKRPDIIVLNLNVIVSNDSR